jgi:DNA-binding transcriptional LysR family regulator
MLLHGVDANLLFALRALIRERNVTRAARAIGIGQSSMSHALSRLRAHFGDPLLVKVGRLLVLTERARSLIEPVEAAATELERVFLREPAFVPKSSRRLFRIVGTDNLELYLMPRIAALLEREAPNVSIRFHALPKDWAAALSRGEADLKLGRRYKLTAGLRDQELLLEKFVCVVRRGHPVLRRRFDLAAYTKLGHVAIAPSLGLSETYASVIDEQLAHQNRSRRVVLTVSHFLAAPFIVAASDLVLTASERLVSSFAPSLDLAVLQPPLALRSYRLSQVWSDRAHADPGNAWLRGLVSRAARAIDGVDGSSPNNR